MKRALGAIALTLALLGLSGQAAQATKPDPGHKVTLCHRTGSATNPYVVITTDIASDGYVKGGHNNHEQVGNGLGGDIIPAYTYKDFSYPGKNLDLVFGNGETGAEVLAAGCVLTSESPSPTESPTPTDSPTPTETPTPTPSKHHTHTPTWTPTWTPTHKPPTNSAGVRTTAFTGSSPTKPLAAAGILTALGLGSLYLVRRRSVG